MDNCEHFPVLSFDMYVNLYKVITNLFSVELKVNIAKDKLNNYVFTILFDFFGSFISVARN